MYSQLKKSFHFHSYFHSMLGLIKKQCLKRIFSDKTTARLLLLLRNIIFHNSVLTTSLREKTRIGKTAKITIF